MLPLGRAFGRRVSGGQRRPSRRAGELLESNLRRGHGLVAIADRRGCRLARYRDERVHHLAPYLVKEHAATHVVVEDGRDLSEQRGLTRCGLWAEVLAAHARRRRELPEAHRGADDEAEGADEEEARHRVNFARRPGGRVLLGATNGHEKLVVRTACATTTVRARQRCARPVGARLAPHGQRPRERRVLRDGRLCDVNANAAWCNRQTFLSTWAA